jgi:CheY-like chemotaxis protein
VARVLVVDDDVPILNLVSSLLRKRGHAVIAVESAHEALAVLDTKRAPDVLVTDVAMPQYSGLELVDAIRERASVATLPVIFLSARVDPLDIESGRALGATYLTKPFVARALFAAIDRALQPAEAATW